MNNLKKLDPKNIYVATWPVLVAIFFVLNRLGIWTAIPLAVVAIWFLASSTNLSAKTKTQVTALWAIAGLSVVYAFYAFDALGVASYSKSPFPEWAKGGPAAVVICFALLVVAGLATLHARESK